MPFVIVLAILIFSCVTHAAGQVSLYSQLNPVERLKYEFIHNMGSPVVVNSSQSTLDSCLIRGEDNSLSVRQTFSRFDSRLQVKECNYGGSDSVRYATTYDFPIGRIVDGTDTSYQIFKDLVYPQHFRTDTTLRIRKFDRGRLQRLTEISTYDENFNGIDRYRHTSTVISNYTYSFQQEVKISYTVNSANEQTGNARIEVTNYDHLKRPLRIDIVNAKNLSDTFGAYRRVQTFTYSDNGLAGLAHDSVCPFQTGLVGRDETELVYDVQADCGYGVFVAEAYRSDDRKTDSFRSFRSDQGQGDRTFQYYYSKSTPQVEFTKQSCIIVPNPISAGICLSLPNSQEAVQAYIYNMLGQPISSIRSTGGVLIWPELPVGAYFIRIFDVYSRELCTQMIVSK